MREQDSTEDATGYKTGTLPIKWPLKTTLSERKKKTYVEDEGKRKDLDLVTGMTWLFKKAMLKIAIEPLFDGKLPEILFFT